jgi:hypothetical protein
MLNDAEGAAMALEFGQAVLLNEALNGRAGGVADHSARRRAVHEASQHGTVVYVASCVRGGVAIIVRHGQFRHLLLPALSRRNLEQILGECAVADCDDTELDENLVRLSVWFSEHALNQVIGVLGTDPGAITLIPVGPLASLPLALAGDPRALIDIAPVSHLPNIAAYSEPAPVLPGSYALGIADPRRTKRDTLDGAVAEIEILSSTYSGTYLVHEQATRDAVISALPDADIIHIAAHARADLGDPLNSGVVLANDQDLLLADVLSKTLAARLVVLSACESALPGDRLPDELVSLPAGFLQAGARGVIGSLWPVDDAATCVLMAEFWNQLRLGRSPNDALRTAQLWLRDVSARQLKEWSAHPGCPSGIVEIVSKELQQRSDTERPFNEVSLWGAFTFSGG